jgi:tRNA A-37 threonylcarbamoyl transferase component Bud32
VKVGERLDERYELEELLGVGGMASVYRARDAALDRPVAIKVLDEALSNDPEYLERFRREAMAMARFSHRHIVQVIDRGEFDDRQYIVLEYVGGETLKDLIERSGPLPVDDALALVRDVALGLAFAHEHGIVHRDVKPHNVLLDTSGTPKVADFGIARSVGPASTADTLTKTGTLLGTSEYVAPEQVLGVGADERSDQYSLGVLLYELLVGEPPYRGATFIEVALRHVHDAVPSVRASRRDVAPSVDALVAKALAKRPEDRFPSMEIFAREVEACLESVRAKREMRSGGMESYVPAWAPAALLALALLVAAGAVATALTRDGGDSARDRGAEPSKAQQPAQEPSPAPTRLTAFRDHDPFGSNREEHSAEVPAASDGNPTTFWTTERYSSFDKPGVGIVFDAGRRARVETIDVVSDTPGFRARIRAGNQPAGRFRNVSPERLVGLRTLFPLTSAGTEYRYYLLWITDPNGRAHVNELRIRR